MAVSKAKKTEQVEKLGQELQKVSSVIVSTYSKLTVAQDYELRKTLRSSGAKYRVVKNTLAERAAKGTKVAEVLKNLRLVSLKKSLSFREKKMYDRAKYLIVSEVAIVKGIPEMEAEKLIEKSLDKSLMGH